MSIDGRVISKKEREGNSKKNLSGLLKARKIAERIEKECPDYKIDKNPTMGVPLNESALIRYYEQKLLEQKNDKHDLEESRKRLIDECIDQASKINGLNHELGLVLNLLDSVSLVDVLDKKEATFTIYRMLFSDGGLKNIIKSIELKIESLESIACALYDIDDDEVTEPFHFEEEGGKEDE